MCVCMYTYVNNAERLRLHKAVILVLIMKYFVVKNLVHPHNYTVQPYQQVLCQYKEKHPQDTH